MTNLRRIILPIPVLMVILSVAVVATIAMTTPVRAERVCGPPECYTAECWWVGPGHRRCRRECRRRCSFYHPPIHYQQPRYAAPYVPPAAVHSGPDLPPEVVGLLILVVLAVTIAAMMPAASDRTARDIAQIEQSTLDAHAQAEDAEQQADAITSYIAAEEAAAFERGRRAAEREWEEYTRYD